MSFKRQREDEEGDGSVQNPVENRENWMLNEARKNIYNRFEQAMILANDCYKAAGDDDTTPSVQIVLQFLELISTERNELNAYYDAQDAKRQKEQEEEEERRRRRQYSQPNYNNDNNYQPPSRTISRDDPEHWSNRPPAPRVYEERPYRPRHHNGH